jgi:hypothetical protein
MKTVKKYPFAWLRVGLSLITAGLSIAGITFIDLNSERADPFYLANIDEVALLMLVGSTAFCLLTILMAFLDGFENGDKTMHYLDRGTLIVTEDGKEYVINLTGWFVFIDQGTFDPEDLYETDIVVQGKTVYLHHRTIYEEGNAYFFLDGKPVSGATLYNTYELGKGEFLVIPSELVNALEHEIFG